MGVPYEMFWHLTFKKLKVYDKAYELRRKIEDEKAYMQGIYNLKALEVALSHFSSTFSKGKCDAKYFDVPLLSDKNKTQNEYTEEELQRQRELFVAKLQIMKANFDLNKKNKEVKS